MRVCAGSVRGCACAVWSDLGEWTCELPRDDTSYEPVVVIREGRSSVRPPDDAKTLTTYALTTCTYPTRPAARLARLRYVGRRPT